jgi:hypothetical protein
MSVHSPNIVIFIPSPAMNSFGIIYFISAECPKRVGEEDVCYLQKMRWLRWNFFSLFIEVHEALSNLPYFPLGFTKPSGRQFIAFPRLFICTG